LTAFHDKKFDNRFPLSLGHFLFSIDSNFNHKETLKKKFFYDFQELNELNYSLFSKIVVFIFVLIFIFLSNYFF
jgi:hypothetical protein